MRLNIRTRNQELTPDMAVFAANCYRWFTKDLRAETYGRDWKECAYSGGNLSAWVTLNKSDSISILVTNESPES